MEQLSMARNALDVALCSMGVRGSATVGELHPLYTSHTHIVMCRDIIKRRLQLDCLLRIRSLRGVRGITLQLTPCLN